MIKLFDARSLAEDLRRATNHELADFLAALDEATRDWITDRLYPSNGNLEYELEAVIAARQALYATPAPAEVAYA